MPKQIESTTDLVAETMTDFINVDLDIYSRSDLEPLVTALGERVDVLYVGRQRRTCAAHLELPFGFKPYNADAMIRRFAALIDSLPKAQRKLWDTAKTRQFSIGVGAGLQPFSYEMVLSCEAVEPAAKLNARIGFTVYAPQVPDEVVRKKRPSASRKG
jgi:hypothetical protein